ncbi:MAG: tripartite tricarboxylate transporter substrate binding protein [Alcaligenaceae bacterium]
MNVFSTLLTTLTLCAFSLSTASHAQTPEPYPNRPIKMVVPFGPGSGTDTVARVVAQHMQGYLGQPVTVENRAGANGFIGAEAVARSTPDGYTVFVTSASIHSLNPSLFKSLPYETERDFASVGGVMEAYYTLLVGETLPVNSVQELSAWLKANPDKASFGWGATVGQIAGATFLKQTNTSATGVPYKSSPQAVTDLIGGQIKFMFNDVTTSKAHLGQQRLKALAVTSPERIVGLENVPTMAQAGVADFEMTTWVGMLVPKNTPQTVIQTLSAALLKTVALPEVAARMHACCSARMLIKTPEEFAQYMKDDRARWAKKISDAGVQPE